MTYLLPAASLASNQLFFLKSTSSSNAMNLVLFHSPTPAAAVNLEALAASSF
ncbi:MAG: hypothetical protein JSR99_13780 [Proteobacteria bacterium]|nr:hypothetical protein [Pseudomonadota bacterium]